MQILHTSLDFILRETPMETKNEKLFPIEILGNDVLQNIATQLAHMDEPQELKSARTLFPMFRTEISRKERLLARLAQYRREANVDKVVDLLTIRPDLDVEVLFSLAALGAQEEMSVMLRIHPKFLLLKRPLHDISGAIFESISLLQHAIWSNDVDMVDMMMSCIPNDEEGDAIRLGLLEQYNDHKENGVMYCLDGKLYQEHHFNLEPLITTTNKSMQSQNKSLGEWYCEVGLCQNKLPAYIRHVYCSFSSVLPAVIHLRPGFAAADVFKLKRSFEIEIDNKKQKWSENLMGLGVDFGICFDVSILKGSCRIMATKNAMQGTAIICTKVLLGHLESINDKALEKLTQLEKMLQESTQQELNLHI